MMFRSYSNISKYTLTDYLTIAMVISLVTMATPISSHVKDIFISYLLRFSDRIDRMKNSYGNFFIQSQSRIDFLKRGKSRFIQSEISCQNESVSSQTRSGCFLAPLQSSFTEVCRVSTSLLKFSRKFAVNHRQSSNRFSVLDKAIKRTSSWKTRAKRLGRKPDGTRG